MNSFIKWIGGKRLLRKKILEEFPDKSEYDRYIEVFGGAGWVLFAKEPRGLEVYNDANGDLVNLFRVVKYHPEALQKELSEKTGIRPNTINALYHDMAESIKFEQLDRICEVLGCDLHDILEYKPNKIKFSWREKEVTKKP